MLGPLGPDIRDGRRAPGGERVRLFLPSATPQILLQLCLYFLGFFVSSYFKLCKELAKRGSQQKYLVSGHQTDLFSSTARLKSVKAAACGRRRVCGGISGQIVRLYQNKELPASFATMQGERRASSALNEPLPLVEVDQEGPHAASSCSNYRLHRHCVRLQPSEPFPAVETHLQSPYLAHCRPRTKENGGGSAENQFVVS